MGVLSSERYYPSSLARSYERPESFHDDEETDDGWKREYSAKQPERQRRRRRQIRIAFATIVIIISTALVALLSSSMERPSRLQLRVLEKRDDGDSSKNNERSLGFRIMQLADFHLGEGRSFDNKTFACITRLIDYALPIDLIVLSGDQLTANNMDEDAGEYQRQLSDFMQSKSIPWTMIFGNHDDAPDEGPSPWAIPPMPPRNGTGLTKTSREVLLKIDASHSLSFTQTGPSGVNGVSNFIIDVYDPSEPGRILLQGIFLDSGGGTSKQMVDESQLKWFLETRRSDLAAFMFQHIPTQQFQYDKDSCAGTAYDGVSALEYDAGVLDTLDDKVLFVGVGHDHGNDYCCPYPSSGVSLCFGRHSGYGGYGSWDRGARVYDIILTPNHESETVRWSSYVQMENGSKIHEYHP